MMYNSADNDFVAKVMAALKEQHVQSILHGNFCFGNSLTGRQLFMKVYAHTDFFELTVELKIRAKKNWVTKHSLLPSDLDLKIETLSINPSDYPSYSPNVLFYVLSLFDALPLSEKEYWIIQAATSAIDTERVKRVNKKTKFPELPLILPDIAMSFIKKDIRRDWETLTVCVKSSLITAVRLMPF